MSTKVITDPSALGWEQDGETPNGTPLYQWSGGQDMGPIKDGDTEGQITTWDGAEWTPDSTVVVSGGNVGIGSDSLDTRFVVEADAQRVARFRTNGAVRAYATFADANTTTENAQGFGVVGDDVKIWSGNAESLTIDSSGKVGIGMTPATRTAKEQLAEWKTKFDARLKAEPKADKKAVTLEITDDAFEVLPTEEALAEWMETRAAGDKLQVAGNGSFSGEVKFGGKGAIRYAEGVLGANGVVFENTSGGSGVVLSNNGGQFDPTSTGQVNLGNPDRKWKDAYFSGTVNSGYLRPQAGTGTQSTIQSKDANGVTNFNIAANGNGYVTGSWGSTRLIQDGAPVIDAKGLISTLSTLRNATKDETTLEGMRDALADAIGGLIEGFENEIATMPAGDES